MGENGNMTTWNFQLRLSLIFVLLNQYLATFLKLTSSNFKVAYKRGLPYGSNREHENMKHSICTKIYGLRYQFLSKFVKLTTRLTESANYLVGHIEKYILQDRVGVFHMGKNGNMTTWNVQFRPNLLFGLFLSIFSKFVIINYSDYRVC